MTMGKIRRIDFHPDEFLTGVVGMTPEDIGIYWVLCARMYSAGGPIPHNAEMNAEGFSRKTRPSTVKAAIERLIATGKLYVCDQGGDREGVGFLYQRRCQDVINSTQTRIEVASKSGRRGGRPRAKVDSEVSEINDLAKGSGFDDAFDGEKLTINHQPPTNNIPPTPFGGDAANDDVPGAAEPAPRPDIDAAFDEFWAAYPSRGPNAQNPKKPARQKFERAVKAGAKPADLIEGARRYASQMRAAGKDRTEFVAQATTFLHQERWKQQLPANDREPDATGQTLAERLGIIPLPF